jgi:NADP-dependent 3-hydroxy acid dehydrogenase YdfG
MGVDFVKASLAAGHAVVATGRDTERLSKVLGSASDLLLVRLDVTRPTDAEAAVRATVERFGRIDVLVNNAASFYAGYFEELSPEQMERQLTTSLVGPMNVTRAVLPVMRRQREGHIIAISSTAGLVGFEFGTAYAASKFGLRALADALRQEEAGHGVRVTTVYPGRTATPMQQKVHRQEGKEYDADAWTRPETVADAILHVLDLPRDATIPDVTVSPGPG